MTSPGSRVYSKVCLFCEKISKKVKGQKQKLIRCEVKNDLEGSSSLGANISLPEDLPTTAGYHVRC